MIYWAFIVLFLGASGTALNIFMGTPWALSVNDGLLFLVGLGMLARVRFMANKGEKEALRRKLAD